MTHHRPPPRWRATADAPDRPWRGPCRLPPRARRHPAVGSQRVAADRPRRRADVRTPLTTAPTPSSTRMTRPSSSEVAPNRSRRLNPHVQTSESRSIAPRGPTGQRVQGSNQGGSASIHTGCDALSMVCWPAAVRTTTWRLSHGSGEAPTADSNSVSTRVTARCACWPGRFVSTRRIRPSTVVTRTSASSPRYRSTCACRLRASG